MTNASAQRAAWMQRLPRVCGITLACGAVDQVTKAIARATLDEGRALTFLGDTFRLDLSYNAGAFLGLGSGMPDDVRSIVFSVGVACVLLGLLAYALFSNSEPPAARTALALVFGGGASNLIDRFVFDGHVTDFLNVGIGSLRTGIFNIADMAISAGVVYLLWIGFRKSGTQAQR
jgi:signal peptidase II